MMGAPVRSISPLPKWRRRLLMKSGRCSRAQQRLIRPRPRTLLRRDHRLTHRLTAPPVSSISLLAGRSSQFRSQCQIYKLTHQDNNFVYTRSFQSLAESYGYVSKPLSRESFPSFFFFFFFFFLNLPIECSSCHFNDRAQRWNLFCCSLGRDSAECHPLGDHCSVFCVGACAEHEGRSSRPTLVSSPIAQPLRRSSC